MCYVCVGVCMLVFVNVYICVCVCESARSYIYAARNSITFWPCYTPLEEARDIKYGQIFSQVLTRKLIILASDLLLGINNGPFPPSNQHRAAYCVNKNSPPGPNGPRAVLLQSRTKSASYCLNMMQTSDWALLELTATHHSTIALQTTVERRGEREGNGDLSMRREFTRKCRVCLL